MASVTTSIHVSENSTPVAYATDRAIYECGCSDIPDGDCDCNGNQLDALGVCGGPCEADVDADGICDDVDDALESLTPVACATDRVRSTNVVAQTFPKGIAIAMATKKT